MGVLYRLVDDRRKLYYDLDRWFVGAEDILNGQDLRTRLNENHGVEQWELDMAEAVVQDVMGKMSFPLRVLIDTRDDEYHDIEDEGYRYCGDLFCSYHKVNTPMDPKPTISGPYYVWFEEPFTASRPAPKYLLYIGVWPVGKATQVWWVEPDHPVVKERVR